MIKREILPDLINELDKPEVLILIGARQVGKTHLLNELYKLAESKKKTVKYFNLELPLDSRIFNQDLVYLYEELTSDTDYLFIDEFQYFENASKFFKAIFDDKKINTKVIASGSSSLEIHKHLKESLAGRKKEKIIYPLSFLEYRQLDTNFEDFLLYGGMPGLSKLNQRKEKIELIGNLLQTFILKDIKSLILEENVPAFNDLIYLLANYQGQIVSVNNLSNELRLDNRSTEKFLYILEQTFVLHSLASFSANLSNEIKKSKKYFLYDLGIRNLLLNNFKNVKKREDKGQIYETYVHNFFKQNKPINSELRFWRTRNGEEVDFIYIKDQDIYAIEVKSKLKDMSIPDGLKKFIRAYNKTIKAFIINENLSGSAEYENISIEFIQLEELELNKNIRKILKA